MSDARFKAVREATGFVRPGHKHGCTPIEIIPGIYNAEYHHIDSEEKLSAINPNIKLVVNTATVQCPPVHYKDGVSLLLVEGLNDDPDPRKKADAMPEGPEKVATLAALPAFSPSECAGDAKKDFERVNKAIDQVRAEGGAAVVHCVASLSRSVAFLLAYIMKEKRCTVVEAVHIMKPKWDATWPNDTFVRQLLEYETELGVAPSPLS